VCYTTVPSGLYALETRAQGVAQCLVHWKQEGKVYPERYNWGGRAHTATESANELGPEPPYEKAGADYCANPICGICPHLDGKTAEQQIIEGGEAMWHLQRIVEDIYLIIGAAPDGTFKCLGFNDAGSNGLAPYPSLMVAVEDQIPEDEGKCYKTVVAQRRPEAEWIPPVCTIGDAVSGTLADVAHLGNRDTKEECEREQLHQGALRTGTWTAGICRQREANGTSANVAGITDEADCVTARTKCFENRDCSSGMECIKGMVDTVEWMHTADMTRPPLKQGLGIRDLAQVTRTVGGTEQLAFFCGFDAGNTTGGVTAMDRLMGAGNLVLWQISPLGCTGLYCEKRVYEDLFTISSLASGDKNRDGVSGVEDPNDYDCLYFPSGAKLSQESHPMRVPRTDQNDFTWMGTIDGSADTDVNGKIECGIAVDPEVEGATQEEALVANRQAVWKLIKLEPEV
jgi:hypothetical protein